MAASKKSTKPMAQQATTLFNKHYGVKTPKEIKEMFMKIGMTPHYSNTKYYQLKKDADS